MIGLKFYNNLLLVLENKTNPVDSSNVISTSQNIETKNMKIRFLLVLSLIVIEKNILMFRSAVVQTGFCPC